MPKGGQTTRASLKKREIESWPGSCKGCCAPKPFQKYWSDFCLTNWHQVAAPAHANVPQIVLCSGPESTWPYVSISDTQYSRGDKVLQASRSVWLGTSLNRPAGQRLHIFRTSDPNLSLQHHTTTICTFCWIALARIWHHTISTSPTAQRSTTTMEGHHPSTCVRFARLRFAHICTLAQCVYPHGKWLRALQHMAPRHTFKTTTATANCRRLGPQSYTYSLILPKHNAKHQNISQQSKLISQNSWKSMNSDRRSLPA